MKMKLANSKHIFYKVRIILNKIKIDNPWVDYKWNVYDLMPLDIILGNDDIPITNIIPEPFHKLENENDFELFVADAKIDLHRAEAEAYAENLQSSDPSIYVILREEIEDDEDTNDLDIKLIEVSLSPYNVQDYEDSGEDQIEKIPLLGPIKKLVEDFVDIHYVPEPFIKRKRDRKFKDERKETKNNSFH